MNSKKKLIVAVRAGKKVRAVQVYNANFFLRFAKFLRLLVEADKRNNDEPVSVGAATPATEQQALKEAQQF